MFSNLKFVSKEMNSAPSKQIRLFQPFPHDLRLICSKTIRFFCGLKTQTQSALLFNAQLSHTPKIDWILPGPSHLFSCVLLALFAVGPFNEMENGIVTDAKTKMTF